MSLPDIIFKSRRLVWSENHQKLLLKLILTGIIFHNYAKLSQPSKVLVWSTMPSAILIARLLRIFSITSTLRSILLVSFLE